MKHSVALVLTLASGLALNAAAQTPPQSRMPLLQAQHLSPLFPLALPRSLLSHSRSPWPRPTRANAAFADLQRKYQPKQTQLKALSDEIDSLTKQLQAQADKLSDEERAARAKTIDDKKKQLQRDAEDAQNDFQGEMQELYNSLAAKSFRRAE